MWELLSLNNENQLYPMLHVMIHNGLYPAHEDHTNHAASIRTIGFSKCFLGGLSVLAREGHDNFMFVTSLGFLWNCGHFEKKAPNGHFGLGFES